MMSKASSGASPFFEVKERKIREMEE